MSSMLRVAIPFCLLALVAIPVSAADTTNRLDIFHTWKLTESALKKEKCTLVTNRYATFLPGKLYDIRPLFAGMPGVGFSDGEFAVFNPESRLCIVYGPESAIDGADVLSDQYNPSPYVTIEGAISVGTDEDGKDTGADQAGWRIRGRSGESMKCASRDDHGVTYDVQFEPVFCEDNASLDVFYIVSVSWRGREYTNAPKTQQGMMNPPPGVSIAAGTRRTIKFGETPGGKGLYLHIAANAKLPPKPERVADLGAVRQAIRAEIAKERSAQ